MVCKGWRKAELKVGGPLRTRVPSDVIMPGGLALTRTVMHNAARGGNLELVRWLRGEGCDWNAWTCQCAASAGRLRVLQWLRANGCPWDAHTCTFAALHG